MKLTTKFITRSALGIALVLVSQLIGKQLPAIAVIYGPFSIQQLITGSLVNCCIVVFALTQGWQCGVVIGIVSAIMAAILGIQAVPATALAIAIGNGLIAYVVVMLKKQTHLHPVICVLAAAAVKCSFLWFSVPLILSLLTNVSDKQVKMMSIMFSWPQFITAGIGGLLALSIVKLLPKQN